MILVVLFALYSVGLIYFGTRREAGFASWHMFADLHKMELLLEARAQGGEWQPLNPWKFLPHTHLNMSRDEFQFFLHYLQEVHQLQVRGKAFEYSGGKKCLLKVGGFGV